MPRNYFLSKTRKELEDLRKQLENALIAGKVTVAQIAGVRTEFAENGAMPISTLLDHVQYSISQLEDANPDDPRDQNPYHQRPGRTYVSFS